MSSGIGRGKRESVEFPNQSKIEIQKSRIPSTLFFELNLSSTIDYW
jgi:hypothetical protein